MTTLTELVTKFSFQGSAKPLAEYSNQLSKSIKGLTAFTAAIGAATVAAFAWANPILKGVDALANLSTELRTSVARIQELGFVAGVSNSSAEELNASLKGLSNSAALAANGMGRGREAFKKLGINVKDSNGRLKDSATLLDEVRRKMNAMNMTVDERSAFAQRLGMSPNMVQLLMRTDDEMSELIKRARELGTLTQEQADAARDYNDSLTVLRYGLTSLKQTAAVALAPSLRELVEIFTDLVANNREWITAGIKFTVEILADLMKMIGRLLPFLAAVGVAFVGAKIYALGFAGAMAVIFSPVVMITGAIAALLVIVDDLIVAFQGGDSVIGKFFKETLNIDLSKTLDQLKSMWQWLTKITSALTGRVARFLGFEQQPAIQTSGVPANFLNGGGGRAGVSNTTDNRRVEQDVTINVMSNDPVRAGNVAAEGVQRQLRDANAQIGVGGM